MFRYVSLTLHIRCVDVSNALHKRVFAFTLHAISVCVPPMFHRRLEGEIAVEWRPPTGNRFVSFVSCVRARRSCVGAREE
eukprot:9492271-Pyramimonas_sp.AAC.1